MVIEHREFNMDQLELCCYLIKFHPNPIPPHCREDIRPSPLLVVQTLSIYPLEHCITSPDSYIMHCTAALLALGWAAAATAHGSHSQEILAGPHEGLWYNTLPGDGGKQVGIFLYPSTGRLY